MLLDDNFTHIVEAVEEGRAAFDNIKRFLTYHLTDNVAELAPFAVWALSAGSIPLMISVLQVLALDIGTDLLPALALGAEKPEPGVMERPPRAKGARLLDRRVLGRAFGFLGPVEATASMAMLPIGAALFFGWPDSPLPCLRFGPGRLVDDGLLRHRVDADRECLRVPINPGFALLDRPALQPSPRWSRGGRGGRPPDVRLPAPVQRVLGHSPLDFPSGHWS